MAVELTKRERIERTLACQETDRVPLYDLLLCDGAIEYFSGQKLPPLADDPHIRETVQRMTGTAISRFLDMTRSWDFGPLVDKEYIDENGFLIHEAAWEKTSWVKQRPFSDIEGAVKFLETYTQEIECETREIKTSPRLYREKFHKHFLENMARLGDTVHLITQQGTGLDEILWFLGLELMTYIMLDYSALMSTTLEALTDRNIAICHAVADLNLSPAVLTYTDIAHKNRLTYSPTFLRNEIFPRLKRLNDAWHEHGFKCLYHSDGYLMEVMDDLVATGIDGLNPIETVAGMSLKEIRQKFPKLFLAGGIDMSQLLSNGAPEEVTETCRQAIRDAYPGYFIGSTTEADNSCKTENLVAMYLVAMEGIS